MSTLRFEWDEAKAAANAKKHGVTFEEARSVFFDYRARLIDDPDHSEDEERFILLGLSGTLRLLVVCHCYRSKGNLIRIISARKATARESRSYPQ
ncbi:MAG: BrnT family toxin [Burkholderiaceae bacterium]|nr:BrnT family toxin [Burkholderiaceae bacterium]